MTNQTKFWWAFGLAAFLVLTYLSYKIMQQSITVGWQPVEGALLYTVYCGPERGRYTMAQLADKGRTRVVFRTVPSGQWFCAVSVTNERGLTSRPSEVVMKEVR